MSTNVSRINLRGAVAYTVLAYALMWLICLPLWVSGKGLASPGALAMIVIGMFSPMLASFLVCRFVDHQPWLARVGLRLNKGLRPIVKFSLLGFAVVTAVVALVTGLAGATGLVHLDLAGLSGLTAAANAVRPPGSTRELPPPMVILAASIAGTVIASFNVNALAALGEEVGWRGYLIPALLPLGRVRAIVLVGVIWAGWHAPIILLGYDYHGQARPVAMLLLAGFCILFGTLLGWLRMRSDSAIPAAVAHGTFNGWMRLVPLLVAVGQPVHLGTASPMGLLGYAAFGALAVWLLTRAQWTKTSVPTKFTGGDHAGERRAHSGDQALAIYARSPLAGRAGPSSQWHPALAVAASSS